MVCYILSDHLCDYVEYVSSGYVVVKRIRETSFKKEKHQQMLLEEEIKHLHLLDDEYQKLYRWNHDTSNHLLALSLLIEQKKYDQALSYIHTLNTSREETKL